LAISVFHLGTEIGSRLRITARIVRLSGAPPRWLPFAAPDQLHERGRLIPEIAELAPLFERRMGSNPHANGGKLLRDLIMPDFRVHAVRVSSVDGSVKSL